MTALPTTGTRPSSAPPTPGRLGRGILLALGLAATLVALRLAAPSTLPLDDALQDLLTLSTSVVVESLPFVVLGVVLSVVVQLWVPDGLLLRALPRTPVLRRAALSFLGVVLPVCECGNVPLARGLVRRGLSVPEATTFVLAAPILNPVTLLVTYQAFGWADGILVWRAVGGFLVANATGWLLARHPRPTDLLTPAFAASCRRHDHAGGPRLTRGLGMVTTELSAVLPALFVGAAVAGLIQVGVSRDLLLALGQDPVWSVLALMALAFVIAICSTVDALFVLSLGSAFTPGAVVAFLVLGPMADVKMVALLRTTFTTRALALVVTVVVLLTATLGLAVNRAG